MSNAQNNNVNLNNEDIIMTKRAREVLLAVDKIMCEKGTVDCTIDNFTEYFQSVTSTSIYDVKPAFLEYLYNDALLLSNDISDLDMCLRMSSVASVLKRINFVASVNEIEKIKNSFFDNNI